MQRVLSFQMARGFGESSEFVTKRMCFSFLFSVGFLSLLCGFLIGRFAAGRAVDIRAEKTRLQFAGNGLESTEHLRESLIQKLQENSFATSYVTKNGSTEDVQRIKNDLLGLEFFHRVVGNGSCIIASIRGSREPGTNKELRYKVDLGTRKSSLRVITMSQLIFKSRAVMVHLICTDRYVVLSGTGEGVTLVVELSKALKTLEQSFKWQPRRSLKFMISLEIPNACQAALSKHVRDKIVGYVELNVQSIGESGYFVTTGSDVVQSTILQAAAGVKNLNYKNNFGKSPMIIEACGEMSCLEPIPRLRLDIPNAALTFVNLDNTSSIGEHPKYINAYRKALAQIIGTSIWRLSEMTLFQWDFRKINNALINRLQNLNSTEYNELIDKIVPEIRKITDRVIDLNAKNDDIEKTKSLEVRVANDFSMDLRRILLCCDDDLRSKTDWFELQKLGKDSNATKETLRELLTCYMTANEIFEEDVT